MKLTLRSFGNTIFYSLYCYYYVVVELCAIRLYTVPTNLCTYSVHEVDIILLLLLFPCTARRHWYRRTECFSHVSIRIPTHCRVGTYVLPQTIFWSTERPTKRYCTFGNDLCFCFPFSTLEAYVLFSNRDWHELISLEFNKSVIEIDCNILPPPFHHSG